MFLRIVIIKPPNHSQVYQHWVEGDPTLNLELQGALNETSTSFVATDLTVLKTLVQRHVADSEKKRIALGLQPGPTVQAGELERQSFDLAVSTVKHDLDLYRVWLTRSRDREASVYFQELQHAQSRKKQARLVASDVMDRGAPT